MTLKLEPMPSPFGTNHERLFIARLPKGMALDALPQELRRFEYRTEDGHRWRSGRDASSVVEGLEHPEGQERSLRRWGGDVEEGESPHARLERYLCDKLHGEDLEEARAILHDSSR